jgi:hypothetical protein
MLTLNCVNPVTPFWKTNKVFPANIHNQSNLYCNPAFIELIFN